MSNTEDIKQYFANRQKEIDGAALYLVLADTEKQPQMAAVYRKLAASEEKHAAAWEENLEFFGRMHGLHGAALKTRVAELLTVVGLEKSADRRVSTYSGGMKRRANLAAGIIHRPRLLVLDEPTVGIDAQSRGLIFDNLRALSGAGKTLVYASRDGQQTGLRTRDIASGVEKWLIFPITRDNQEAIPDMDAIPGYSFTPDGSAIVISYGGEFWRVPMSGAAPAKIPFSADVDVAVGPEVKFEYPIEDTPTFNRGRSVTRFPRPMASGSPSPRSTASTWRTLLSGRMPLGELPRILGHETAGEVVELGPGAAGWAVGDRAVVAIDVVCGRCRHCLGGQTHRCAAMRRIGFERDGGHAEYVAVPATNLIRLPDGLGYEAAAILPDAVACMYHSLIRQGLVRAGQTVLILGAGGLGIHGVQVARWAGAAVIATSRRPERLRLAEQHGAITVSPATQSVADVVMEHTQGEGVDVVVDNIGTRASVREALSLLCPGGKLLVVAYVDETFEVPAIPLFKPEREIIGCRGSSKQDLVDVVQLTAAGRLSPVIGARYSLDEAATAAERLAQGDVVGRIILTRA